MALLGGSNSDVQVLIQTKGDASGVENIEKSLGGLGKTASSLIGSMTKLGVAAGAALGAAGIGAATFGIKMAGEFEQSRIAFKTLLGDFEQADAALSDIEESAKITPFNLPDLIKANQLLVSAGVGAGDANQQILNLGDAISATGGGTVELNRLAANLQQIKAVGKASSVDIKQFAFAGINIYGLLADATGKSVAEVKDMEVSYDLLTEAFAMASGEGGKFNNAMQDQSSTFNGIISNLQDVIGLTLKDVVTKTGLFDIVKKITSSVLDFIVANQEGFIKGINNAIEKIKSFIKTIQLFIQGIKFGIQEGDFFNDMLFEASQRLGISDEKFDKIAKTIEVFTEKVKITIDTIKLFIQGIKFGIQEGDFFNDMLFEASQRLGISDEKFDEIAKTMESVTNKVVDITKAVGLFIKGVIFAVKEGDIMNDMLFEASQKLGISKEGFSKLTKGVLNAIDTVKQFVSNLKQMVQTIAIFVKPIIAFFVGQLLHIWESIREKLIPAITEAFKNILPKLIETFQDLKPILQLIASLFGIVILGAIEGFILALEVAIGFISAIVGPALNLLTNTIGLVVDIINVVIKLLKGDWAGAWDSAVEVMRGAWETIKSIFSFMKAPIEGILSAIGGVAGSISSAFGKIPKFALGTSFAPGGLALVGERGPELVNLPRGAQVIPNNNISGAGQNVSINFYGGQDFRDEQQQKEIIDQVVRVIGRSDELSRLGAR